MSSLCDWREQEFLLDEGTTISGLKMMIEDQSAKIEFDSLCVSTAVNNVIESEDTRLQDGDEISFIPPIAGG